MSYNCHTFAEQIKSHLNGFSPEIAIILGSGLGSLAELITETTTIKYSAITGFPQSSVSGHEGQFVFGTLFGKKVLCMQGRIHLYEGFSASVIAEIIKTFKLLNIKNLIVTNAAGSLNKSMPAGSIMMLTDHINLSFTNPLIGPNDETFGPRFPDVSNAYDSHLQAIARQSASTLNIKLHEGTYIMVSGPNFETAAEIRAFSALGADAVGMSTVPEVIAATYCGIKVLGFSVITNLGTGLQSSPQSHTETLEKASLATNNLAHLLSHIIERI